MNINKSIPVNLDAYDECECPSFDHHATTGCGVDPETWARDGYTQEEQCQILHRNGT